MTPHKVCQATDLCMMHWSFLYERHWGPMQALGPPKPESSLSRYSICVGWDCLDRRCTNDGIVLRGGALTMVKIMMVRHHHCSLVKETIPFLLYSSLMGKISFYPDRYSSIRSPYVRCIGQKRIVKICLFTLTTSTSGLPHLEPNGLDCYSAIRGK